jgi:hypothetical protein
MISVPSKGGLERCDEVIVVIMCSDNYEQYLQKSQSEPSLSVLEECMRLIPVNVVYIRVADESMRSP